MVVGISAKTGKNVYWGTHLKSIERAGKALTQQVAQWYNTPSKYELFVKAGWRKLFEALIAKPEWWECAHYPLEEACLMTIIDNITRDNQDPNRTTWLLHL